MERLTTLGSVSNAEEADVTDDACVEEGLGTSLLNYYLEGTIESREVPLNC